MSKTAHILTPKGPESIPVPDWTNWVAQDGSGIWYAYKAKPKTHTTCFLHEAGSRCPIKIFPDKPEDAHPNPKWTETLQQV